MKRVSASKRWLPARLSLSGKYVYWVPVEESTLRLPFLELKDVSKNSGFRRQSLQRFQDLGRVSGNSPFLLLHHTGRCGSTLLGEALRLGKGNIVYNEPDFLGAIQEAKKRLSHRDYISLLRSGFYAFSSPGERAIIKTSAVSLLDFRSIQMALPKTPYIFLVRNPSEVVASYLHLPAEFMTSSPFWPRGGDQKSRLLQLKYIVSSLCRQYESVLPFIDRRAMILDYEQLNSCLILSLYSRLEIPWPAPAKNGLKMIFATYSKDPEKKMLFQGDHHPEEIRELVSKESRLIGRLLFPYYKKILSLREKT